MRDQRRYSSGEEIRSARTMKGLTQKELAEKVSVSNYRISDWENNKAVPLLRHAEALDKILGTRLSDRKEYESKYEDKPSIYDVFVATPMASISNNHYLDSRKKVERIVHKIRESGLEVYWAGASIDSHEDFEVPDQGTERNLTALKTSKAFVFAYFGDVPPGPSGALVELGIALGLGKPVTIFVTDTYTLPYMMEEGFPRVADRTGISRVRLSRGDVNKAISQMDRYGVQSYIF